MSAKNITLNHLILWGFFIGLPRNIVEEVEDLHFNFNDDKKIDETDIKNEKRYAEEGTEVFGSIDEKNEEGIDF